MNLGKTIERLLKIEPALKQQLIPIRDKYLMRPRRSKVYWQELLDVMNSDSVRDNPKWSELRQVVIPKKRHQKTHYTFDEVGPDDVIIGVIPENISDRLRRYDLKTIRMAKQHTEAEMTGNSEMLTRLSRENEFRAIELKRLWILLKDHFQLWDKDLGATYIRRQGPMLVLAQSKTQDSPLMAGPAGQHQSGGVIFQTPYGAVQTSPQILRKILKMLGLPTPPGMDDENDSESE